MNAIYSLLAGTLLAAVDIIALVLLVKNLGKNLSPSKAGLLAFFLMGKLAFLGLVVFWLSKAPCFDVTGAIAGLTFPFVILVLFQAMKNTPSNTKLNHGN